MMNIGENIRLAREQKGVSQGKLAEMVGVTQSMVCQIERGTKGCSMQLGAQIAKALEVEIGVLFGAEPNDRTA